MLLSLACIKEKNSLFVCEAYVNGTCTIHIVLLGAVLCKIIGCTKGC